MKITLLLLFCILLQAKAEISYSQTVRVSLNMENATVEQVLNTIEEKSEFYFLYNSKLINVDRIVSVKAKEKPVETILDEVFASTDVMYKIENRQIILNNKSMAKAEINQQTRKISGIVTDEKGEPIIGANVVVVGTTNGIITDIDGQFSLEVPENAKLKVSYIGYNTQEVSIGNRREISIVMTEDTQTLEEVVVVGYGVQKKGNLTGAVASVGSEVLEDRPITGIGAGLQGTIGNLNITQSDGQPGQSAKFNVRGTTNFAGTGALVLVDGVEMDPNLLNPADIKDVVVLKDGASAAIYGARAAYGVVLITTRTGFTTQKPIVSFSANYAINSPTVHPDYMNSLEYMQWMNDANMTTNGSNYFDDITRQHVNAYYNDPTNNLPVFHHPDDADSKYRYCGNTDWYKALNKKTYPIQQYNANIQGGTSNFKYYTSAGFYKQAGIAKFANEDFKRYNILSNVTYKAADWIQLGLKTTFSMQDKLSGGQNKYGSSSIASILAGDSRPFMPVYHPDGNFAGYCGDGYFTNMAAWQSQGGFSKSKKNDIWISGNIKLMPFEGFTVNADYTYNYYNYSFKNFTREYWDYDAIGPAVIFPHTSPNSISYTRSETFYNVFNIYAEYQKSIAEKHNFKGMVGFNQEYERNAGVGLSRSNLISNEIPYLSLATGDRSTSDFEQQWAVRGLFFRLNYNYDEKYLIEIDGRYDGSSRFPKADRFKLFPSFSFGYRISKEDFWQSLSGIISDLKIRGSWSSLGNQAVNSNYPYISTYNTEEVGYLFGGTKQMGVYAPGLVSDKLTWESVMQYDLGLNITFLDNKLISEFDWYSRSTKDMLTKSKTLPAILGVNEPQMNAADLRTNGWEALITYKDKLSNGLSYSASISMSDYQAEITKYDNPTKNLSDSYYKGLKLGEIWGFVTDGFFKTDQEAAGWDQSKVVGYTQLAGDIKFADINGDGKVDYGNSTVNNSGDRKVIGNSTPRYNFGIRGFAEWKGFDITLFFQGVLKRDIIASNVFYLSHYTSEWAVPQKMNYDYWREDNTDAFFPRARLNGSAVNINQTHFLQNAAYIRLKNFAIGYTIPEYITRKAKISKLRIYFNADNMWEYSKMPSTFDPELATANAYPFMRSYSFGANLSF